MPDEPFFKDISQLKAMLQQIPAMGLEFVNRDEGKMYIHTLLILGILNRTYELTESGIWTLENKRPHTGASMLRSLIETLALAHYVHKQTKNITQPEQLSEKLRTILFGSRKPDDPIKAVNILTCIDSAIETFPQLRESYDECSELVHPNSSSLFHFMKANPEKGERIVEVMIPFYEFKDKDEVKLLNKIGECCHHTASICRKIYERLYIKN